MDEATEKSLVMRTLRGDHGAFGQFVDQYQRPLFNVAYRMLSDPDEAKDVTQTAFVKAFEKLATFDCQHRFFSWICKILTNEARNRLSRNQRVEPLSADIVSEARTLEEEHDDRRQKEQVQWAIAQLTGDYRAVIVLKYFGDLSYDEIAGVLDVPTKTVKSRLFTARRRLAEILTRLGVRT